MQQLEALIGQAGHLAAGRAAPSQDEAEVGRIMKICNACRYCEGFCAVFPAMTRRLEFGQADIHYMANLCHNCGACLHACQYAPPHEFAVNVPQAMAKVRARTYTDFAAMLADPDVDAVIIGVADQYHVALGQQATRLGSELPVMLVARVVALAVRLLGAKSTQRTKYRRRCKAPRSKPKRSRGFR